MSVYPYGAWQSGRPVKEQAGAVQEKKIMFNGRMLNIIRYLKEQGESTYKAAARDLGVSERSVRYDVDRINDILSLEHLPEIEKHSKGVLVYPGNLDLKGLEDGNEVVYTSRERMSILLLILMIRSEDLKINQLSQQFRVSRTTVKNDMAALDEELKKDGMGIGYSGHFYLSGPKLKRTTLMNQEFRKYIEYLINPFTEYNSYEFYCIHIIHKAFEGISIPNVVMAVDGLLEDLGCTLTSSSYLWYMSNVVVLIWYVLHDKVYPLDISVMPGYDREVYGRFGKDLEVIIGRPVSGDYIAMMAKMFDFTNKIAGGKGEVDPVHAQAVTFSLISSMSKRLNMPFDKDSSLVEGLLNHMIPLIQRINNHVSIKDNVVSLLGPKEQQLYNVVTQACSEVETLDQLGNADELVYLTICFMASIRRMKTAPYKKVLLVCGHGYGTTTMLKEALLSEYQIHIMDTLPIYKLSSYPDWAAIDYVLSTIKVNNSLPKPCITVSPILQQEDRAAIEGLGIPRKAILSSYYSIEEKLGFLDESTRARVMDVVKKELGYQTAQVFHNPRNFSSFLKYDCIELAEEAADWREAVRLSAGPLLKRGFIEESYVSNMIGFIEEQGFYAVSDGSFALLHGKGAEGIRKTSLSLLVTGKPVGFGDKKANVIFCLASRDSREHIPAVVTLMRMVKTTSLIHDLVRCRTKEEAYQCVLNCEFEVL